MKKSIILFAAVLVLLTGCAKQNVPTEAPTEFAKEVSETIQTALTSANEKVTAAMETINAADADGRFKAIQEVYASIEEAKAAYTDAANACADYASLTELKATIETAVLAFPENMPLDVEFGIKKFMKAMDKVVAAQGDMVQKAAALAE